MPAKSKKQERFMQAVANNPAFAKKVGVPQSVGKEYTKAEGGMFRVGGSKESAADRKRRDEDRKATKRRPEKKGARGEALKARLGGKSVPRARKNVGITSIEELPRKKPSAKKKVAKKMAKGGSSCGTKRKATPAMKRGGSCSSRMKKK